MRLRVGHQHSRFWSIVTRFVVYYSPLWGPVVISIVVEPQGALMCRSSILVLLADSGPFHGLLLTVWGPGVLSTINKPRGAFMCRSSALTVLADSGPFHGLLLIDFGFQSDFMVTEP